jgi:Flp pilus assembly protein TadB
MRLSRPVYESLPYIYMAIGGLAVFVFYLDPVGPRAIIAFCIAFVVETAALTLFLRRKDYRALSREYSGETIDLPSTLHG